MKAAYTGWTWITNREPEAAKNQLKQAFQECKFLGYDTVENFAFIRDYYADDPQALVDLTKECGVDLVNLYGHFTFDVEEAIRIAKEFGLRMTLDHCTDGALIADELAEECDFFSIGTNDLTQYTCALDRQNAKLEPFFNPHHPAVLRAIKMTIDAGHRHGIWVGICGELGADTALTETFLRMGVDELSMNAKSILPVRKIIRGVDLSKPSAKNV